MQLASRFAHHSPSLRSSSPLTDDQIRAVAPSIFAVDKHASRSDRYTYIPTSEVLTALRREGFEPFMVCQMRVRQDDRCDFTKHMVRLRHVRHIGDAEANEIVLLNSHDGTSSYQLIAGLLRYACSNGLVFGDTFSDVRVHRQYSAGHGFGAQACEAMDRRVDYLAGQGLAERRGQRVILARNLLATLRNRELASVGQDLQQQTGKTWRPVQDGQPVSGVYRQSIQLASGRFAMLDDGMGFQLVPWKPMIEQRLGLQVSVVVRGQSVTWQLGRRRGIGI